MAIVCKTNWTADMLLEIEDLNRVESNIAQIQTNLQAIGFIVPLGGIKTDWDRHYLVNIIDMNRIKYNINKLRESFYVYPNTPVLIVSDNQEQTHDWKIQNTMEKILDDINKSYIAWIRTQATTQMYAGNFYSGEEVIL